MTQPTPHGGRIHVVLCTPCYGGAIHVEVCKTISALAVWCSRSGVTLSHLHSTGPLLILERNRMVVRALDLGATHVLFLDADTAIPQPDWLGRLLVTMRETQAVVVGACYVSKPAFVVGRAGPDRMSLPVCGYVTEGQASTRGPAPSAWPPAPIVAAKGAHIRVGTGCMLVDASVFRTMARPWFEMTMDPPDDGSKCVEEDEVFCDKAAALGPVVIEPRIATVHYGTTGWTWEPPKPGALSCDGAEMRIGAELARALDAGDRPAALAALRGMKRAVETAVMVYPPETRPGVVAWGSCDEAPDRVRLRAAVANDPAKVLAP